MSFQIPYIKRSSFNSRTSGSPSFIKNNSSNKVNSSNVNLSFGKIKNGVSSTFKNIDGKKIFLTFLISLISIILLYIFAMVLYYLYSGCYKSHDFINYLFNFNINACINDPDHTKLSPASHLQREILHDKEVYHLSNQNYTYQQAKCKCAAYGGKLATKNQMVNAYNKGADWCTYGWSEGQNAFYPTQKCTWDKLQRGPKKYRNNCGMPGVNGGFFANPMLKFGVNCYGIRPKGKLVKEKKPECKSTKNGGFCELDNNYSASHVLKTDNVSSFNSKQWSQFDD